jgi:hypothetical protein
METTMGFRIAGLDPAPFRHWRGLTDAELAHAGVRRVRVEDYPSAPCRISLDDARIGEEVLLFSFLHQPADTAYRQQGPIFVRDTDERFEARDEIPPALARRPLSLRGFDREGMMIEADVVDGAAAAAMIERFFANAAVDYIHAHYARRGCFAARIDRG